MAKWRRVHIGENEWKWVISKGCSLSVVIREPDNGKCHTVSFSKIDPNSFQDHWDDAYVITPAKVKAYIEQNLL
jgi:hypothetical protein